MLHLVFIYIYIYIYIFLLMMYFDLFELSMIGGDTMMYSYLFFVSHCAMLIIDLSH